MAAEPKISETPAFIAVPAPDQEAVPKRRGRPPRDPNAPKVERKPRRSRVSLETRIGAFLSRVNIVAHVAASMAPSVVHKDDPLTPNEIVALARGLNAQAANHPTFRKYLEFAIATSDNADLVFVVSAIAVVRLANHGIVPEGIGAIASAAMEDPTALAMMFGAAAEESKPEPPEDEFLAGVAVASSASGTIS